MGKREGIRKKENMKKSIFLFSLLWLMLIFAACGKTEDEAYYDIRVESQILEGAEDGQLLLGRQYYQGESVSLIAEQVSAEDGTSVMDVYIQPVGKERQLLMSGVSRSYRSTAWYLDGDGNCFIPQTDGIIRLDGDGNMLYHSKTEGWVRDICGLEGGRIILLTYENTNYGLAELDPVTGVITKIDNVTLGSGTQYIGASGNRLMLLDEKGFWYVDLKKGARTQELSFGGTFYTFSSGAAVVDFWVDGNEAGIIWNSGVEEQLAKVNASEGKEIVTVRGENFVNSVNARWLKEQVHLFNQSNDTFYVVLQDCEDGTDIGDFCTETNLQLASGKGADIICQTALSGDIYSMIDNGVFADLTPLMESSGMSEEDYFPGAFDGWKYGGGIYGVGLEVYLKCYTMDKNLLDSGGELTIESFLDAMLNVEERRFYSRTDAGWILEYLLQGSENLWGMVDWQEGSCDFSGELFSKMLKAAQKCAYDKQHDYPEILEGRQDYSFYQYETESEMERRNQVMAGVLFDDGCHAAIVTHYIMGINAKSKHIDGAWQLLTFLLGEEAQSDEDFDTFSFPVNRGAFDQLAQRKLEAEIREPMYDASGRQIGINYNGRQDATGKPMEDERLTQEIVDDLIRYIEDAKPLPIKTQPLISIILEETADYFSGVKSEGEVIDVLQNRVQLYLDEQGKMK